MNVEIVAPSETKAQGGEAGQTAEAVETEEDGVPVEMVEDHIYHSEAIASKRGRSSNFKIRTPQKKRFYGSRSSSEKNNSPAARRRRPQRRNSQRSRKN